MARFGWPGFTNAQGPNRIVKVEINMVIVQGDERRWMQVNAGRALEAGGLRSGRSFGVPTDGSSVGTTGVLHLLGSSMRTSAVSKLVIEYAAIRDY